MTARHGTGGSLRRRVMLFVLAELLVLVGAGAWLSALMSAGDDLARVLMYLALFAASVLVLAGMVREIVAAHTAYVADLAARQAPLAHRDNAQSHDESPREMKDDTP